MASVVGEDYAAGALRRMFATTYPLTTAFAVSADGRTTTKTRITCDGQQVLRVDDEDHGLSATPAMLKAVLPLFEGETRIAVLVISDYDKGSMSPEFIRMLLAAAATAKVPVMVDTKPSQLSHYRGVSLIKVNECEATAYANDKGYVHPALYVDDVTDRAMAAAKFIRADLAAYSVVVTCGAHGAVYVHAGGEQVFPVQQQHVYDVTGAGDAYLATLAVGCVAGWTEAEAIDRANVAAGLAISRHFTVPITRTELEDAMLAKHGWPAKAMGPEAALAFIKRRREEGNVIVMANGCYDTLHAGHLRTLDVAKRQGDILLVATNTDESIHAIKGAGRPVTGEHYRVAQLAMFGPVDVVITFDGDVESLVRKFKPDVLVKGGEYINTEVPGANYVAQRGGKVVFTPMVQGVSTTCKAEVLSSESTGDA